MVFAELAEVGDDVEAVRALDLCLAFAVRILRDRGIEQRIVKFLRDSERTEGNPLQRSII